MIIKNQKKFIYYLLFVSFFIFHYYQLFNQHWSGVLDQDFVIIYNSILINSGFEQEYRDHPAFTTFLLNSFIFKIISYFSSLPSNLNNILASNDIDSVFQIYFYISRTINFLINLSLIFVFSKIINFFQIDKNLKFLIILTFVFSIGFIYSFFAIRSENVSLLFLCLSVLIIFSKNKNYVLKFFLSGVFFALAMFAKIQVIFLGTLLILFIPLIIREQSPIIKNNVLSNYFIISLVLGILIYVFFQFYIQEFPRFQTNKYLDLIVFIVCIFITYFYFKFSQNFKKSIIFLSSFFNGFIFLVVLVLILDLLGLLQVNKFILLRLTNPLHYMTEFTGSLANGVINFNYILKNIIKFFSSYNFNLVELFLISLIFTINLKNKNYTFGIFLIFILNTFVMNYRYLPTYHLYYVFIYLIFFTISIKNFQLNLSLKLSYFVLVLFFINSLNFFIFKNNDYKFTKILSREKGFSKICNEFNFKIKSDTYENLQYIMYYHNRLTQVSISKICKEIN